HPFSSAGLVVLPPWVITQGVLQLVSEQNCNDHTTSRLLSASIVHKSAKFSSNLCGELSITSFAFWAAMAYFDSSLRGHPAMVRYTCAIMPFAAHTVARPGSPGQLSGRFSSANCKSSRMKA